MSLREKFSVPKPIDLFARDFLAFSIEKYNAPQCASVKVKVLFVPTYHKWLKLWKLSESTTDKKRSLLEYGEQRSNRSNWMNCYGYLHQIAIGATDTGQFESSAPEQLKKDMLAMFLREELADAYSQFDAVIFLNLPNIQKALDKGVPFPKLGTVAHECTHIIERYTGKRIIDANQWELGYWDTPSFKAFTEFVDRIGGKDELVKRYGGGEMT